MPFVLTADLLYSNGLYSVDDFIVMYIVILMIIIILIQCFKAFWINFLQIMFVLPFISEMKQIHQSLHN